MTILLSLPLSAVLLAGVPAVAPVQAAPALELEGDAQAGHVTASWSAAAGTAPGASLEYELQEAGSELFAAPTLRYRGPHTASVLSGLRDGTYFFRVRQRPAGDARAGWSVWSAPASFEVEHHPLRLALGLFGLGAVVFTAIFGFLAVGSRRTGEAGDG